MLAGSEHIEISLLKQFTLFFVLLLGTLIVATLLTDFGVRPAVPKPTASLAMAYDPAIEMRISDVVEELQVFACPRDNSERGAHLLLRTGEDIVQVHLADAEYLRRTHLAFSKGDKVEIVGMKIYSADFSAIAARQVVRGEQIYSFRDPRGRPLWTKQ